MPPFVPTSQERHCLVKIMTYNSNNPRGKKAEQQDGAFLKIMVSELFRLKKISLSFLYLDTKINERLQKWPRISFT